MHLRGPMNISQLAVYHLPSEMHTLRKRNTVPFYNRRRAMNKRDYDVTADTSFDNRSVSLERQIFNTCGPRTVTTTVTVTECTSTFAASTAQLLPDTTYIGPPLPCMPTPTPSAPGGGIPGAACTCGSSIPELGLPAFTPFPGAQRIGVTKTSEVVRRDAGDWSRVAYYTSAAQAQATGFSFLANQGDPEKSGTFD
jgi:hypothetical protein